MATYKETTPSVAELFQALEDEKGFQVEFHSHAKSILYGEFGQQLSELATVLADLSLPISEIIGSGGGETKVSARWSRLDDGLQDQVAAVDGCQ